MSHPNPLSGKTVLVTGATGFIGRHLTARLRQITGINLALLSRQAISGGRGVTWVSSAFDQLSKDTWLTAGLEQFDLVLHLGAFIPKTGDAADRIEDVYRDNLVGTRLLLESFPLPPKRVVLASSIDVYAPAPSALPLSEASPLGPASLYGASKLFCEQLIRTFARQHACEYAILRYGHIFGPGEDAYRKLIPQTIRQLMNGEVPVIFGDGSAERDFLYVEDAVEATLRAAVSPISELSPVNVVRGASSSIRSVVESLVRITGHAAHIQYRADKFAGNSLRFDNSQMRKTLGDWSLVSLDDGLEREVQHMRRRADGLSSPGL